MSRRGRGFHFHIDRSYWILAIERHYLRGRSQLLGQLKAIFHIYEASFQLSIFFDARYFSWHFLGFDSQTEAE
jgi:hypothetical protein